MNVKRSKNPWGVEDYPGPEHARWGQSTLTIPTDRIRQIGNPTTFKIANLTHPEYDLCIADWEKWRLTYEGGDRFVNEYLKKFSRRETAKDFQDRKVVTPIPSFAKGAINEIKNAIFQRIADTTRVGGPETYQQAVLGELGGVDLKGATINWFIGHYIIAELLTMRKVGVFVDMPVVGPTLRDKGTKHPYFYVYKAEDIRNWDDYTVGDRREYTGILLRERQYTRDKLTGLPTGEVEKFRHMWYDGGVHVQFYNLDNTLDGPQIDLEIERIPFVTFEISESLLKDVANAQIALLNLDSSDVSYALRANFPFYTEQFDDKANSNLLRQAQEAYTEINPELGLQDGGLTCTTPAPKGPDIDVGATQGRRYPKGMERPGFIAPPADPLRVSMEKQRALKEDIRLQVHLALSNIQPKMASAESKGMDLAGLESGLSYIGLELEHGERQLASYWAMYEGSSDEPTINYPKRWSLKTPEEVQKEVDQLQDVRDDIPSTIFKKEVNLKIAELILGNRVTNDVLTEIRREIQQSKGTTSNPDTLKAHLEAGLVSQETATVLSGYPAEESVQAAKDHAARLARIKEAQSSDMPAARGTPDESPNPAIESSLEKQGKQQRGPGNGISNSSSGS